MKNLLLKPFSKSRQAGIAATEYMVVAASLVTALAAISVVTGTYCHTQEATCKDIWTAMSTAFTERTYLTNLILGMPF